MTPDGKECGSQGDSDEENGQVVQPGSLCLLTKHGTILVPTSKCCRDEMGGCVTQDTLREQRTSRLLSCFLVLVTKALG